MSHLIFSSAIEEFIREHQHAEAAELLLKYNQIDGVSISTVVDQIIGRRKAALKIPSYCSVTGIVYPPAKNMEQSSSESTAVFKAEIVTETLSVRSACVDLTGGFGVDSFFLSKIFDKLLMVEPNRALLDMSSQDHSLLGAENIEYQNTDALTFLKDASKRIDLFYIDPSRRNKGDHKVYTLKDSEPDVTSLMPLIFSQSDLLLLKASPLLDIRLALSELQRVSKVYVVAVDNECKELLFFVQSNPVAEPNIVAVNIGRGKRDYFEFNLEEEKTAVAALSEPLAYLYEPNAAILKAGAFKIIASRCSLFKVHMNTHLYTSNKLINDFPGKIFSINTFVKPERKSVIKIIPEGKANITTRNYPMTPDAIRKAIKFEDGGDKFLIGFTGPGKKYLVVAERIR